MSIRRQQQGELIAQTKGSIKRFDDMHYVVSSQSGNAFYNVQLTQSGFMCLSQDSAYRGIKCKHVHAVELIGASPNNEGAQSKAY